MTVQYFALGIIGTLAVLLVLLGIVCSILVLVDEIQARWRSIRIRRAQSEAVRRYRVPTQR